MLYISCVNKTLGKILQKQENMSDLIKKQIIDTPDYYFNTQRKALEQRLDGVKLSSEQESEIIKSKTFKTIRDKTLGLFKIGEIINTVLNWNDDIDKDLKEAKKEYLLSSYFDKTDRTEDSIMKIKQLLTSPQGNTLFNKILRILDNTPPDLELTNHLANVLYHITNTDFYNLFDDHKYALNQIEMLTPQALTILADNKNWPTIMLSSYSTSGPKVTSDWLIEFSGTYAKTKGITEMKIIERIKHSINDLIKNRYIEAHLVAERTAKAKVKITEIGQLILPYIVK